MPFRPIKPQPPVVPAPIFARARTRPTPPTVEPTTATPPSAADQSPPAKPKRPHHKTDRSGTNWDENGDYITGRGRPPKDKQWVAGQSGNPGGPKPRKKADPLTELDDAILAPFMTKVNGQPVETTAGVYGINILKAKAAEKDRLSAVALIDRYEAALRKRYPQKQGDDIPPEQQAMIDELFDTAGWEKIKSVRNRLTGTDDQNTDDGEAGDE